MAKAAELIVESKGFKSRLALAAGGLGLFVCTAGAIGLATSSSDAMISAGFDRAFAKLSQPGVARVNAPAGAAKTEDEWLRVSAANPALIRTAAVGQQLRLTGLGTERMLRIVDVVDLGEADTHIDTAAVADRVLLVTCRDGDDAGGTEYRIRIEGGYIRDIAVADHARTL